MMQRGARSRPRGEAACASPRHVNGMPSRLSRMPNSGGGAALPVVMLVLEHERRPLALRADTKVAPRSDHECSGGRARVSSPASDLCK